MQGKVQVVFRRPMHLFLGMLLLTAFLMGQTARSQKGAAKQLRISFATSIRSSVWTGA